MNALGRIGARLVLVLAPVALGLVAAEWYASTTVEGNASLFVEDPELYVVRKPGTDGYTFGNGRWIPCHINREGLRGEELPASRDPSERWILCCGDSFTFGGGVETSEAWPQQLQAILGAPEASKMRVLNGGANGWDTSWQRLFLEKRGLPRLKPAVVVLGFNWNDLEISLNAPQQAISNFIHCDRSFILRQFAPFPRLRDTHSFRLLYCRVRNSDYVPTPDELQRQYVDYREKRAREAIQPEARLVEPRRKRFGAGAPDNAFWIQTDTPAWKTVRAEMKRIRDLCDAAGARFVVAILPEPTWDGPGTFPGVERMTALLDAIQVPWVDVQPGFLATRPDGTLQGKQSADLWLQYDPFHPTPRGQRMFAEAIAAKLRELGLASP